VPQRGFEPLTHALRIRRSLLGVMRINNLRISGAVCAFKKRQISACAGTKVATVSRDVFAPIPCRERLQSNHRPSNLNASGFKKSEPAMYSPPSRPAMSITSDPSRRQKYPPSTNRREVTGSCSGMPSVRAQLRQVDATDGRARFWLKQNTLEGSYSALMDCNLLKVVSLL
jgi:hypothetical protein